MNQLELIILTAVLAASVGLIVGIFVSRATSKSEEQVRNLRASLKDAQEQSEAYQQRVAQHFSQTARKLNNLTEQYKDVHHHLAAGAEELCVDRDGRSLLSVDESQSATIDNQAAADFLQPPLDYAPKEEHSNGTLAEDFGLEKVNLHSATANDTLAGHPGAGNDESEVAELAGETAKSR